MKRLKALTIILFISILLVSCGGEPKVTGTPSTPKTWDAEPSGKPVLPPDAVPKYQADKTDKASREAIEDGVFNEFLAEGDVIFASAAADINGDGDGDFAFVSGAGADWNEFFDRYKPGGEGFLRLSVIFAEDEGFALKARNESMVYISEGRLLFSGLSYKDGVLVISNESVNSEGEVERLNFGCAYDKGEDAILLDKVETVELSPNDPMYNLWLSEGRRNFGDIELSAYTEGAHKSPGGLDSTSRSADMGDVGFELRYPMFNTDDKQQEKRLSELIDEGFTAGQERAALLKTAENWSIDCTRVYDDGSDASFIFSAKASGGESFRYGMNVDLKSMTASELGKQLGEAEAGRIFKTQGGSADEYEEDELSAALEEIGSLDRLRSGELAAFSRRTEGSPFLFFAGVAVEIEEEPDDKVENAAELIEAIASDTRLYLVPGMYDFDALPDDTEFPEGVSVSGGTLLLTGINNLSLLRFGAGATTLVSSGSNILRLENCSGIELNSLSLSHKRVAGSGAAISQNGGGIRLVGCTLSVSSVGIESSGGAVSMSAVQIINCESGIMKLSSAASAEFTGCSFRRNGAAGQNLIEITDSPVVTFEDCTIKDNSASGGDLFHVPGSGVTVTGGEISGNNCAQELSYLGENLSLTNVSMTGNSFSLEEETPTPSPEPESETPTPAPVDPLTMDDLTLGIVKLGMSSSEVVNALGDPIATKIALPNNEFFRYDAVISYMGMDVGISGGFVYGINTDYSGVTTARGIKIGHTADAVREAYGQTELTDGCLEYLYEDANGDYSFEVSLYFRIEHDVVTAVGVRAR